MPTDLEPVLEDALCEIDELRAKARDVERRLKGLVRHMPEAEFLMSVPGIGVLTATALVAYVGDIRRFRSGRHFAAYLGLTPREHSSGLSRRIGRITKHGNRYLRMLLIHGARSVLRAAKLTEEPDGLRAWAFASQPKVATTRPPLRSPTSLPASRGAAGVTADPSNTA